MTKTLTKRMLVIFLSAIVAVAMGQFITQSDSYAASGHHDHHSGQPGDQFQPPDDFGGSWWNDDEDEYFNGSGDTEIAEDPEAAEYAVGNLADDLSIELSGDDESAAFQWYENTADSEENATAIDGANESTLSGDSISTAAAGTHYYYCVVTLSDGTVLTSGSAEITVHDLAFTIQPVGGTYAVGKNITLTAAFIGNGDIQWYSSTDSSSWTEIDGADGTKLRVSSSTAGTTYYKAVATNGLDEDSADFVSISSSIATVTITGTSVVKATVGKLTYKTTGESTAAVTGVKSKKYTSFTIPATVTISGKTYNVTAVSSGAFNGCRKLTAVTIGSSVTSVGTKAFGGDSKLRKITFSGSSVTAIGKNAFKGVYRSVKFVVPSEQLDTYKTLIQNAGAPKNASFTIL